MLSFGPPRNWLLALCCLFVLGIAPIVSAQDDEDSPYRPGLVATYSAAGQTITRTDETIAFDWQDAAADLRLPSGNFMSNWKGRLWARGAGQYHLHAFVLGQVTIKLAGKTLIEGKNSEGNSNEPKWLESQPLDLEFDHHPLEVTYRRDAQRGQLALFWSGPDFRLEPIPAWALAHEKTDSPSPAFERGRQLASALRCAACHKDSIASLTPAPALNRLSGNINEQWLVDWLESSPPTPSGTAAANAAPPKTSATHPRRMPHLNITHQEATAIAAYLLREPPVKTEPKKAEPKETKDDTKKKSDTKSTKKSKGDEKPKPSAEEGEKLLLTRGCLACHQLGSQGLSGLFGGGDLTSLASKRPADFLTPWLADPASINRDHRMPVFQFTTDEITSLNLWAKQQSAAHKPDAQAREDRAKQPETLERGQKLVESLKCNSCHSLSHDKNATPIADQKELTAANNWTNACTNQPNRAKNQPGYQLAASDATALKDYYSAAKPGATHLSEQARGRNLLAELNCLACHQREGAERASLSPLADSRVGWAVPTTNSTSEKLNATLPPLQDKLPALAETHSTLAPLIPAMTPPALNSVGDKLHDQALADSITRKGRPHRPYLLVQMPKFELSKRQLEALTAYFTSTDRIPNRSPHVPREDVSPKSAVPSEKLISRSPPAEQVPGPTMAALAAAGPRLVTTDGLACTSCHQVGSVLPTKAPLNARGPDMSMLGSRIRREWFDRWCNNPARIVPRMEMPAVKIPVRGVLNDNVEDQLAAVWHILNTPGFQPPEPDPVRVLRLSGLAEKYERPLVIHDVFKDGDKTYLFPLVIGLPNRHNILFDLETNRLAAWWLGDTARQRTKGKSWYWEMGGKSILNAGAEGSEITLVRDGKEYFPDLAGQSIAQLTNYDQFRAEFEYRLLFPAAQLQADKRRRTVKVGQLFGDGRYEEGHGISRAITLEGHGPAPNVRLRVVSEEAASKAKWDQNWKSLTLQGNPPIQISFRNTPEMFSYENGHIELNLERQRLAKDVGGDSPWRASISMSYTSGLVPDQYSADSVPTPPSQAIAIQVAPGFDAKRLPLSGSIMPTGFAWEHSINNPHTLLFTTLKGELYTAEDSNRDGLEDNLRLSVDGLAAPYGVSADVSSIHVLAKDGLLQVSSNGTDTSHNITTMASGWGHTDDYHDWAVGPVPDGDGGYYIALPCQQDARSAAAAAYRGKLIRAIPSYQEDREPEIEIISAGHRFPMGMARNRDGELFVTDNQGNYNPFNELNHVKPGAHFGFINALEKEKGVTPPPLTEPAINIPHPWTRSVNGICFLDTPGPRGEAARLYPPRKSIYGALEGHLVGCEYDTRRLIRMSLEKVNGEYQGCCYPLSIPPANVEKGLLGPIVCAIKPTTGELYVGEIRDSGWGASNNIGQIVKIKIEPEKLPCGIAEVKATKTGFTIDFFQPVDKAKAADLTSYSLESYRRESTPAYGGSDIDRRPEKITKAELSPDAKRITLTLENLRPRHVYEFRLKNISANAGTFHPDEAHYTLKQIPN